MKDSIEYIDREMAEELANMLDDFASTYIPDHCSEQRKDPVGSPDEVENNLLHGNLSRYTDWLEECIDSSDDRGMINAARNILDELDDYRIYTTGRFAPEGEMIGDTGVTVGELAGKLDQFGYDIDPYGYFDDNETREDGLASMMDDLREGTYPRLQKYLQEVIDEGFDCAPEAQEILDVLNEYDALFRSKGGKTMC